MKRAANRWGCKDCFHGELDSYSQHLSMDDDLEDYSCPDSMASQWPHWSAPLQDWTELLWDVASSFSFVGLCASVIAEQFVCYSCCRLALKRVCCCLLSSLLQSLCYYLWAKCRLLLVLFCCFGNYGWGKDRLAFCWLIGENSRIWRSFSGEVDLDFRDVRQYSTSIDLYTKLNSPNLYLVASAPSMADAVVAGSRTQGTP